jgi:hypothetical protein
MLSVFVVIAVILSGPHQQVVDPQITPHLHRESDGPDQVARNAVENPEVGWRAGAARRGRDVGGA